MALRLSFFVFAAAVLTTQAATFDLYIGTYTTGKSKGIYRSSFDDQTGSLSTPEIVAETKDPSFLALHPSKPFLYAVNESVGKVSAYSIDPVRGTLTLLNQQDSHGAAPCHLAVDATGRMLVAANYDGGSFAAYPIDSEGKLAEAAAAIQFTGSGPDKQRQEAPHAHSTTFTKDNRFVLLDDLGTDRTMIYRVDPATAHVQPNDPPFATGDPGAGPRHLAIDPAQKFVYVVNEMGSSVTRFAFDAQRGALRKLDSVSTLPSGFHGKNDCAEIAIAKDGRTLYASNRGHDSIAVFRIAGGTLHLIQNTPTGGHTPRSFTLSPSGKWLLAANQDTDDIFVFRIDMKTGTLTATGKNVAVSRPVCLLFRPQNR